MKTQSILSVTNLFFILLFSVVNVQLAFTAPSKGDCLDSPAPSAEQHSRCKNKKFCLNTGCQSITRESDACIPEDGADIAYADVQNADRIETGYCGHAFFNYDCTSCTQLVCAVYDVYSSMEFGQCVIDCEQKRYTIIDGCTT